MTNLNEFTRELQNCIRCGNCRRVCPVFKKIGTEATAPRGKVQLARAYDDQLLSLDEELLELLSYCLSCKTCVQNCPSGVKTDSIVEIVRSQAVDQRGLPFFKKVIFRHLLRHKSRWERAAKLGPLFEKLAFKKNQEGTGNVPRLDFGLGKRRLVAPLAAKSLRETCEAHYYPAGNPKLKVGFFTGCMLNYVYSKDGEAVIKSLVDHGCEVVVPKEQHCCGTPLRVHGDYPTAVELAMYNINVFSRLEVDRIVVACASCGLSLKHDFKRLLANDSKYSKMAADLAAKTCDYSELLTELGMNKINNRFKDKVLTYHDPCHLRFGQGVWQEPRQLLRQVTDKFVELPDGPSCCGGAGSFSLQHYDMSMAIGQDKANIVAKMSPDGIVTSCPACKLQLQDSLHQRNIKTPVYQLVEIFTG